MVTIAAVTPLDPGVRAPEVVSIRIAALRVGPSLRAAGLDPQHVATLAEVAAHWPPIVVNQSDRALIDGHHRVAAARQLGLRELRATWFDGSPEDVYIEFVRRNVGHGLPLTLPERRAAARQLLHGHGDRSDRAIASVCGVSPTTVARLRKELDPRGCAGDARETKGRVGLDGRVRPLNGVALRGRIAEKLALQPEASLRTIATEVGASPETVRSVRNELRAGGSVARAADIAAHRAAHPLDSDQGAHSDDGVPRDDRAFTDRDGGEEFLEWFEATSVETVEPWKYLDAVPLSRVYEIADIARLRAQYWTRFAEALEARVRRWA